ncbi:hypothetical protein D3C84_1014360 [compost metagenome]
MALRSPVAVSVIAIAGKVTALPVSVCSVCSAACTEGATKAIPAVSMCTARAKGRNARGARGVTEFFEHGRMGAVMRAHI